MNGIPKVGDHVVHTPTKIMGVVREIQAGRSFVDFGGRAQPFTWVVNSELEPVAMFDSGTPTSTYVNQDGMSPTAITVAFGMLVVRIHHTGHVLLIAAADDGSGHFNIELAKNSSEYGFRSIAWVGAGATLLEAMESTLSGMDTIIDRLK